MRKSLLSRRPRQWTKMIRKRWATTNTTNSFASARSSQARPKPPARWEKMSREFWMAVTMKSMKMIMTDQGPGQGPSQGLSKVPDLGQDRIKDQEDRNRTSAQVTALATKSVAKLPKRSAERGKLSVKLRNRNS